MFQEIFFPTSILGPSWYFLFPVSFVVLYCVRYVHVVFVVKCDVRGNFEKSPTVFFLVSGEAGGERLLSQFQTSSYSHDAFLVVDLHFVFSIPETCWVFLENRSSDERVYEDGKQIHRASNLYSRAQRK